MAFAPVEPISYDPSPLPYVVMAGLVVSSVFVYRKYRRRRADGMGLLAKKHGLQWLGMTLPSDFPRKLLDDLYSGWAVPRWSSPHNVIGGAQGEDYLLAFDITVAKNDTTYQRTIVARRSRTAKAKISFTRGYIYRCLGLWHISTPESTVIVLPRMIELVMIEKLWEQLR